MGEKFGEGGFRQALWIAYQAGKQPLDDSEYPYQEIKAPLGPCAASAVRARLAFCFVAGIKMMVVGRSSNAALFPTSTNNVTRSSGSSATSQMKLV
jgi:hypothetical protein